MEKIVKKWGGSLGILFDVEDVKIHDLKEGDVLDIEICKLNKLKGGKEKRWK